MGKLLDFAAIKANNPIEDVAKRLGLKLVQRNGQFRGPCPSGKGGERALVITPAKALWYSFGENIGGDCLQLVAFVNKVSVKEAASWIAGDTSPTVPEEKPKKGQSAQPAERGFRELDYLIHDHEAVIALGIDPEDAAKIGCGYAPRGSCKGAVAWPVRTPDGNLIGYIALSEIEWLPKEWKW